MRFVRGNPVRVRDCPAAVCRNDRRYEHWSQDREATAIRSTTLVRACESEDLPAVSGAPRLAAHRLVEWASGRNGCSRYMRAAPVRLCVRWRRPTPSI